MKKLIFIYSFCVIPFLSSNAQEKYESNGPENLQSLCGDPTSCTYSKIPSVIYLPRDGTRRHWELYNMEFAIKKTGDFIATGDLAIMSVDTGVVISYDILFYDENDELLYTLQEENFEFYAEPGYAEPLLIKGKMDKTLGKRYSSLSIDIYESVEVPYYDIKSDCYHACKIHRLNEAIKAFKKAK